MMTAAPTTTSNAAAVNTSGLLCWAMNFSTGRTAIRLAATKTAITTMALTARVQCMAFSIDANASSGSSASNGMTAMS